MKKITLIIMTLVLVISNVSVAFAAETIPLVKVGDCCSNVFVEKEENGEVYFTDTYHDVRYLFPQETSGMKFPAEYGVKTPIQLWTTRFGFDARIDDNTVYLEKRPHSENIEVIVNGKLVEFKDQQPVIKDDRTFVPVRFIAEELGYTVQWNGTEKSVVITNGESTVKMYVGAYYYYKDGKMKYMGTAPFILGDRTMEPLRFVAEAFGQQVEWDGTNRRVIITTPFTKSK